MEHALTPKIFRLKKRGGSYTHKKKTIAQMVVANTLCRIDKPPTAAICLFGNRERSVDVYAKSRIKGLVDNTAERVSNSEGNCHQI